MNIHLPLFEVGDKIEVFKPRTGIFYYIISEVYSDHIIATCGIVVEKKNIAIIHKKYGAKILNPYFQLNFRKV
jgi:hypothetical protein